MDRKQARRTALLGLVSGVLLTAGMYFGGAAGCGSSSTTTPPPSGGSQSTTSGGLATINLGDKVVSFIPNGTSVDIVTVEEGSGSALTTGFKSASVPITTSFVVDSCAADSSDLKVICVGFLSSKFAIVDVSNIEDLLSGSGSASVDEGDTGTSTSEGFSGGSCLNCGVLADVGNHQFIISSGDGYRIYDYSKSKLKEFLSDSTTDLATENFGFDSSRRLIISPEYETTDNRLWVINIDTDKVYQWVHTMKPKSLDATNGLQLLDDNGLFALTADSASEDPVTGVLTIGDEYTDSFLILNMNEANFDDTALTFDPPASVLKLQNIASSSGLMATGQAVDNVSHILFLEDEFGVSMGAVQLPTSAGSGPISISESDYTTANVPDPSATCTSTFGWSNVGDPHGLSLYTSNVGGHPKGLLVSSDKTCLASIDLNAFLGASEDSGTNTVGDASSFVDFTAAP